MDILDTAFDADRFFALLAASEERLLMLDYDGTLAPFTPDRDRAVPWPGVPELIDRLIDGNGSRVVIVTGRGVDALLSLLGTVRRPEIWGSHGWERLRADGGYEPPDLPPAARLGLDEAALLAGESAGEERIERKPAGIALHWRGLGRRAVDRLRKAVEPAWRDLAARRGLRVHPFDGGIEIRPTGRDKGTAVSTLLAETPGAVACYLGDDLTDEDAFEAIGERGAGILVGTAARPTAASARIRPPGELLGFLQRWIESTEG
ncbi:MAG TPA: trehalose-phosphatase [Alphaproteobacteria bacterium]|nr:trehalose-phosphatase [Alphaproteobacteria bacterium]